MDNILYYLYEMNIYRYLPKSEYWNPIRKEIEMIG